MRQQGHKTDTENRTQTMRFHPFVFTGKERDEETGYGYFGARYMDHELMTMWLSVDPMADKYPSISPYAYCAWNPVKLVDPDGMEFDPTTEEKYIKPYEDEVRARMKFIDNRRGTRRWKDKYDTQYQEYEKILTEIEDLRKDQGNVYSIRFDEKLDSDGALVYNGEKDDRKRLILIKLKKRAMSVVSHELKHAYQYYKGQLGFILDQSGKQVGNNNCKTFEREAFTRGNMFEDALLIKGSLSLRIYNLDPGKYIFQHGTKYENYPEDSGISLPSGYTFVSNHKYCFF